MKGNYLFNFIMDEIDIKRKRNTNFPRFHPLKEMTPFHVTHCTLAYRKKNKIKLKCLVQHLSKEEIIPFLTDPAYTRPTRKDRSREITRGPIPLVRPNFQPRYTFHENFIRRFEHYKRPPRCLVSRLLSLLLIFCFLGFGGPAT